MHARQEDNGIAQVRAWRCLNCHLRLWLVLAAVLALDLYSKHVAFARLGDPDLGATTRSDVVPGLLEFQSQRNDGAAFGMFRGQRTMFLAVGVAAMAIFLAFFARSRSGQWFLHVGIGLVLGGALGNIYDRIVHIDVRDFIKITTQFRGRDIYPAVFNIADMALVVGVVMIMLSAVRNPQPDDKAKSR